MVLVTGGSGLVGNELITRLLSRGKVVRAIYNKTPLPEFNSGNLQQLHCNILDTDGLHEAMQDVEQVYHCAAIVSFNPKKRKELFKINVEGTANVINAALETGVKKMVYVSSIGALSRSAKTVSVNEKMFWLQRSGKSNYALTKYLAEMEIWRGIGEGLEAAIVNPVIILGPGNWETGSTKIFKTAYEEFPWYSEGSTGFVDVRDVAKAMTELMESNISGERFILSAGDKTYKDLFSEIAIAFGKKPPHKKVTPFIANTAWRVEAFKSFFTKNEPLVTKETSVTAMTKTNYENTKLLQFLPGFEYIPLGQTITDTCNELRKKYNLE